MRDLGIMTVEIFPESVAVSCFPDGTEPRPTPPRHKGPMLKGCRWFTDGDVAPDIRSADLVMLQIMKKPHFIVVRVVSIYCGRVHGHVYGTNTADMAVSHPGWMCRHWGHRLERYFAKRKRQEDGSGKEGG